MGQGTDLRVEMQRFIHRSKDIVTDGSIGLIAARREVLAERFIDGLTTRYTSGAVLIDDDVDGFHGLEVT